MKSLPKTSSVARGGSSPPPHWLVKYAKSHAFCAFEADFLLEMENSPPIRKQPPSNVWICENGRNNSLKFGEDLFFFGDHLTLGRKKLWISDFGRKITLNFGEDLFFFGRSPNFGQKKPLNFRASRDISPQVSGKPSEPDSRSMKIRVKVVCTLLTLSK